MQNGDDRRDAFGPTGCGGNAAAQPKSVRKPPLQRQSGAAKRKRTLSTVGSLVSDLIQQTENCAADADFGGRARQRRKRVRILRRQAAAGLYVPGERNVREIVDLWLNLGASDQDLVQVVRAVCSAKAALPLVLAGRRWPMPDGTPATASTGDLSAVGPALAVRLPPSCVGALLRIHGPVRTAVLGSLCCIPVETQHVLSVRRPDLYWFVATCNYRLCNSGASIRPLLRTAIEEPWTLHIGCQALRDFTWAADAVEASFARPGADIVVGGTPAAAVSLRDKTLLLYVLLWGKPAYVDTRCPSCAPAPIRTLVSALTAPRTHQ